MIAAVASRRWARRGSCLALPRRPDEIEVVDARSRDSAHAAAEIARIAAKDCVSQSDVEDLREIAVGVALL